MRLSTICLLIVLLLGVNFGRGEVNSCSMLQRLHGEMINIKQAKENAEKEGGIVSVPKAMTVNSSVDCEQGCCGNINCTVYLFYPRQPSNDEHQNYDCFFLNCRPQNLCSLVNVSSKAEGAVVGIRDLQLAGNSVEPKMSSNLASVSLSTEAVPHANDGEKKSNSTTKPSSTASTQKSTNATSTAQSEVSTTSMPLKVKKTNENNHTTYGSLVIALAFGILFFLAVLVLIGRPWWYSFHRPRYSKVDYLMNGL